MFDDFDTQIQPEEFYNDELWFEEIAPELRSEMRENISEELEIE